MFDRRVTSPTSCTNSMMPAKKARIWCSQRHSETCQLVGAEHHDGRQRPGVVARPNVPKGRRIEQAKKKTTDSSSTGTKHLAEIDITDPVALRDRFVHAIRQRTSFWTSRKSSAFNGHSRSSFVGYFLNHWTQATESWLLAGAWESCGGDNTIPDGVKVYVGVDMALFTTAQPWSSRGHVVTKWSCNRGCGNPRESHRSHVGETAFSRIGNEVPDQKSRRRPTLFRIDRSGPARQGFARHGLSAVFRRRSIRRVLRPTKQS